MRAKPPLGWMHPLKTLQLSPALCALIVLPGVADAASNPLTASVSKVLPVLVQVDSHGKVTSLSPATARIGAGHKTAGLRFTSLNLLRVNFSYSHQIGL